jgi:hypothetical protein
MVINVQNGEDATTDNLRQGNSPMSLVEELSTNWQTKLQQEISQADQHSPITRWLIGEDHDRYAQFTTDQRRIAEQAMDYRYRILCERYLNQSQERAYRNLIQRLSSIFVLRNKIKTWISLSRDRQRSVVEVLQEVLQELLQQDNYMQQQITWIAQCTSDRRLRNSLVLASLEEYCLRPIRNQPLLMYRFVNYLRRSQRGGMTQVPNAEFIRLVSDEIGQDEDQGSISLLDNQAVATYEAEQAQLEQQELRQSIVRQLTFYLEEKVDPLAASWLQLYLQGITQEAIAEQLNIPIKQVYRLREKVSYHALKVFSTKHNPELIAEWLSQPG